MADDTRDTELRAFIISTMQNFRELGKNPDEVMEWLDCEVAIRMEALEAVMNSNDKDMQWELAHYVLCMVTFSKAFMGFLEDTNDLVNGLVEKGLLPPV